MFRENYLAGDMPTFALHFSRPGGQIVCQYYLMLCLGKEGYRLIHQACYDTAPYLAQEIAATGPSKFILMAIAGTAPRLFHGRCAGAMIRLLLFDFYDRLRARGWQVAAYTMVPDIEDVAVMRILVRHGLSQHMAHLRLNDIRRCLEYFEAHPVTHQMTAAVGGTYNHDVVRA